MYEKIEIITMMYNELFLAPYFCQHYSFADKIRVILDTDTNDGTEDILSRYKNVSVEYFTFPDMMDDILKVQKLSDAYSSSDADWVMMPDADEFIFTKDHLEESVRAFLERFPSIIDLIYVSLYQVYRNRKDEDLVLEKGYLQRRHGNKISRFDKHYIKPIVLRSNKKVQWRTGFHELHSEEPLVCRRRVRLYGAHWTMADPCFCVERRVHGRRDRQSKYNLANGLTKHQHYITEESILAECNEHLDDPQVF